MQGVKIAGVVGVAALMVAVAGMRLGRSGGIPAAAPLASGVDRSTRSVVPDPFGTDEQVMASLSDVQRANIAQRTSPAAKIAAARDMATRFRFTGRPSELGWHVARIEEEQVPTSPPTDPADEYWTEGRGMICDLLRPIGVAWVYAGPFAGMEERVVVAVARFAAHPDRLVRGQAGMVLHAIKHAPGRDGDTPLPGPGEDAMRALMADDEDRALIETYVKGILTHARDLRDKREHP